MNDKLSSITGYDATYEEVAEYILGGCSMGVMAEVPEAEHISYIVENLKEIAKTEAGKALLYYLADATDNQ